MPPAPKGAAAVASGISGQFPPISAGLAFHDPAPILPVQAIEIVDESGGRIFGGEFPAFPAFPPGVFASTPFCNAQVLEIALRG
jgi:hypothetical protein